MINAVLNNQEASNLLVSVFQWLDTQKIKYCIERNYDGYPDKLTGDVDILVSDFELRVIADGIKTMGIKLGWECYHEYTWDKTSYIGLFKDIYPDRYTLTIELFAGARWHGLSYLPASIILNHRIKHGITWKPHPSHQAIITTIHHLLYNRYIPDKYRDEVWSLINYDFKYFIEIMVTIFGSKLGTSYYSSIYNNRWEELENNVAKYKCMLIFNIIKSPSYYHDIFTTLFKGIIAYRSIRKGVTILIYHDDEIMQLLIANKVIELADDWHIFQPPFRKILNCNPLKSKLRFSDYNLNRHLVKRGGVSLICCRRYMDLNIKKILPIYSVDFLHDRCMIKYIDNNKDEIGNFEIVPNNIDDISLRLWSYILSDRVNR